MAMLDEAHYWAATEFGAAELGDVRRTGRLVSTMAAIARAPDESLPRQLGSLAGAKAAYRLFDCGAVTREAVMDPHLAQCRAEAARHPTVLMVHDDTTLDFSTHRRLHMFTKPTGIFINPATCASTIAGTLRGRRQ